MSHSYDEGEKRQVSILGPTLKFKGELTANEELVIQGQVEGKIKHSSNLKIGKEGRVKADVRAELIVVEGTVDGDLDGRKAVIVKDSANVTGNIVSPTVTLHEGSTFNGSIDMSNSAKAKTQTPAAKPAEASKAPQADAKKANQAGDSAAGNAPRNHTAGAA
jgi:cytoskeletal protein CcmA (bactofilin family)